MKKIGNWYCADSTKDRVALMVEEENFPCVNAIAEALKYVRKFDNAIDIGTWIGDSTIAMSTKFKNVLGFEANQEMFECCNKNLEIRNIRNCKIENVGISNKNGIQNFVNNNFSAWVSTLEEKDLADQITIKVNTIKLDDLNLKDIDFVKIDVDSHEGYLLDGATEFLKNNSPVILIENKVRVHTRQNSTMPDPEKLLNSLGYKNIQKVGKADFIFIKPDE
jgi:FkbM family methyltransferase